MARWMVCATSSRSCCPFLFMMLCAGACACACACACAGACARACDGDVDTVADCLPLLLGNTGSVLCISAALAVASVSHVVAASAATTTAGAVGEPAAEPSPWRRPGALPSTACCSIRVRSPSSRASGVYPPLRNHRRRTRVWPSGRTGSSCANAACGSVWDRASRSASPPAATSRRIETC